MSTTVACLLVAFLPLASRPADDPPKPKKEFAPPQGTWKLASLEIDGKEIDLPAKPPRWVIKGNKVHYGGQELAVLTLDASTTPRSIDLGFVSPRKVYEGVYEVGEDTLKVCVNRQTEGVKDRPLGFATKDKPDLRLLVFKRQKDVKGDPTEGLSGYAGLAIRAVAEPKQLVIADVLDGGPARKAGLKKDDVLVTVGGQEASNLRAVIRLVQQAKPRSDLTFRVRRDGKEQDITVKVGVVPFYLLD
jgi:uncharacterized protein (TIGR03067 family)